MARKKINEGSLEEQKKDELNGRISQIRQSFFDDNNRLFSEKIHVNEQALSQICSGKRNAGIDVVQRIVDNIPLIDANWLLTGVGDALKPSIPTVRDRATGVPSSETIANLNDYIALLKEKVSRLEDELRKEKEKVASLLERMNMEPMSQ